MFWVPLFVASLLFQFPASGADQPEKAKVGSVTAKAIPAYSLPYRNFGDLICDGYCLGMSSAHGFSRLSKEQLNKLFGPTLTNKLKGKLGENEQEAIDVLRLFSVLQTRQSFQDFHKKKPLIIGSDILEARSQFLFTPDGVALLNAKEKRKAHIEKSAKSMKSLVSELKKKDNKGQFLTVAVLKKPKNEIAGLHSLYLFDAEERNGKVYFHYLDPNLPRQPQVMSFDLKTGKSQFSNDDKRFYSIPMRSYSMEEAVKVYQKTIEKMRADKLDSSHALLKVLGLGGARKNIASLYEKAALGKSAERFNEWEKLIKPLYESYLKNNEIYLKMFEGKLTAEKVKASDTANKIRREKIQEAHLLTSLAVQNELDASTGNLWKFQDRLLSGLTSKKYQSAEAFSERGAGRGTHLEFLAGVSLSKLAKVALESQVRSLSDGIREGGRIPKRKVEEKKQVASAILPFLLSGKPPRLASRSTAWSRVLPSDLLFVDHLQKKITEKERALLYKRMDVQSSMIFVAALASSQDKDKRKEAMERMQLLSKLQKQAQAEWLEELKKKKMEQAPDFSSHRGKSLYYLLVENLENFDATKWEPQFRDEMKAFVLNWLEFFEKNNIRMADLTGMKFVEKLRRENPDAKALKGRGANIGTLLKGPVGKVIAGWSEKPKPHQKKTPRQSLPRKRRSTH